MLMNGNTYTVFIQLSDARYPTYATATQGDLGEPKKEASFAMNVTSPFTNPDNVYKGNQISLKEHFLDKTPYYDLQWTGSFGLSEPLNLEAVLIPSFLTSPCSNDVPLFLTWAQNWRLMPDSITVQHNGDNIFSISTNIKRIPSILRFYSYPSNQLTINAFTPTVFGANGFGGFQNSSFFLEYDLENRICNVTLRVNHDVHFIDVRGAFEFLGYYWGDWIFDGNFRITSSNPACNDIILSLKSNFSEILSVTLEIEQQGGFEKLVINAQAIFDSNVPTIVIRSPFIGFENIVFDGTRLFHDNKWTIELKIRANGTKMIHVLTLITIEDTYDHIMFAVVITTPFAGYEKVVLNGTYNSSNNKWIIESVGGFNGKHVDIYMSANMDYSKFDLISSLTTTPTAPKNTTMSNQPLQFQMGWSLVDPFFAHIRLQNGDKEYSAKYFGSRSGKKGIKI